MGSGDRYEVRGKPLVSLLIGGFLAVQLILPVRGVIRDTDGTRGNFSWNLHSQRLECRMSYLATYADGSVVEVDHRRFFHRRSRRVSVFQRDVLPAYHAYVCEELRKSGTLQRLEGICLCSNNGGEFESQILDSVDLCNHANYGVIER